MTLQRLYIWFPDNLSKYETNKNTAFERNKMDQAVIFNACLIY